MKETDIAYIAGLIDGEGYIGIKRRTALSNGRVNPSYQERIQIRMVDEPAIKFIAGTLGGNYYTEKPNAHKGRPLYCFQASDQIAVKILQTILPYLKVKRQVAEKVLEFRIMRSNPEKIGIQTTMKNRWGKEMPFTRYRFSEAYISRCEKLWQDCKDINHGIS